MRLGAWRIGRSGISVVALFVPAAALGGAAIIALRAHDFHALYAVGAGCVTIVLYAVLALLMKPRAMPTGPIGDNCYYLGFIFTLVSLAWTLFALSQGTSEDRIVEVISGFGIALFTTLAGLVLRVALNPPRVDLADEEQRSRVSLAREAYLLQKELIQTTAAHKQFGTIVRQSLEEFADRYARELAEEADERRRIFMQQMEKHEAAITAHLITFGKRTTETFDRAMREQLQKRLADFDAAAETMGSAAVGSRDALSEAASAFEDAAHALQDHSRRLGATVAGDFDRLGRNVDRASAALEGALETSADELERITQRIEALDRRLAEIEDETGARPRRTFFGLGLPAADR